MNRKLYIHELIDVIGHNRARYMHHMTANWCPIGHRERKMNCFGVWATVGSTGAWPQVVNLWELSGWKGLAANFEHELVGQRRPGPVARRVVGRGGRAAARGLRPDRAARAVEPDDRRAHRGGCEGRGVRPRARAGTGRRRAHLPRRARGDGPPRGRGARVAVRRRVPRADGHRHRGDRDLGAPRSRDLGGLRAGVGPGRARAVADAA